MDLSNGCIDSMMHTGRDVLILSLGMMSWSIDVKLEFATCGRAAGRSGQLVPAEVDGSI